MQRRATVLFLGLACAACTDLSSFRTGPEEAYAGRVVGIDESGACDDGGPCSVFRRGFTAGTTLSMRFDPTLARSAPGSITTSGQSCGSEVFIDTPLLPIPALEEDQLALYDFPGGGRIRNYVFALAPTTGPLAGRDAVAFVSLLRDGHVEVRILSGSGLDECSQSECPRFASGDCDFFGVFRTSKVDVTP
ncbi:MAG: hypothetical protein H5U40_11260 [Polyangiaceae bacterium]|nr:hypothetical protein [Polyangiaceae bacterium]